MKKRYIVIAILFFLLMIQANCYAKYGLEKQWVVAKIQIDNTLPKAKIEQKLIESENKIEITLIANEPIKAIEGWEGDVTKKIWKKRVAMIQEVNIVEIEDMSGNCTKIVF